MCSWHNLATCAGGPETAGMDSTHEHKVPSFVNSKFAVASEGDDACHYRARFQGWVELDSRQKLMKTSQVSSWVLLWMLQVRTCGSYICAGKWYNEAFLCGKIDFFNLTFSNSLKKWKLFVTTPLSPNNYHNFSFGPYWSSAHFRVSRVSHSMFTCQLKCPLLQKASKFPLNSTKWFSFILP